MKKIIVFVSLAFFLGSSIVFAQDTTKTKIITTKFKLPSVDVKTIDGATFNTSQLTNDGKPIIISFWALWCTNCIKELKAIQEVYDDWQEETGVKVVAVSIDDAKSVDKVKPFVNGKSWDYQILLDPNKNLYRALNINQIPIYIPRLSENAKHLSLEAVNTEPPDASYFRKIKWIRYINQLVKNGTERLFDA